MPRYFLPATSRPSSTATISWSTAPSPAVATGRSSSRIMSPCAGRSTSTRANEAEGNTMLSTFALAPSRADARPLFLAMIAGVACALAVARALPVTFDAISNVIEPLCASAEPSGSTLDKVEPVGSYALPNVPGKRVTIVRVFYGPGGFTRPHRHSGSVTAYISRGEIRSQLGGGPVETFKVGQSFFEPPGSTHMISANASNTEPAELIAVFVADEGAQLTTFLD